MALIKCKECGHMVSDKAKACPNCGCPVSEMMESPVAEKTIRKWNWKSIAIIAGILAVGVSAVFLLRNTGSNQIVLTQGLMDAVQKYDEIHPFQEGLALVIKDGRYGYINGQGEEVIPCQRKAYIYREGETDESVLPYFSEGRALIYTFANNTYGEPDYGSLRFGYINSKGEEVIPIKYKRAEPFGDEWALVEDENGKQTFIDKTGNTVFPVDEDIICFGAFHDGLIKCTSRENQYVYGFMNKSGEMAIPAKYSWVRDYSEGMAFVQDDGHKAFIDTEGHEVLTCDDYYEVGDFHEGLVSVVKSFEEMKVGFLDKKGNVVIPITLPVAGGEGGEPMLEEEYYSDGLYHVSENHCYIDKTGNQVLHYDSRFWAGPFSEGIAVVNYWKVQGLMDKEGKNSISQDLIARADQEIQEEKRRAEEERLAAQRAEEERIRLERERAEAEVREVKSWIEGNWRYRAEFYGSVSEMRVGISGDYIVVMMNGQHYYSGTFTIEGDQLVYNRRNGSADYILLDKYNHRLMADESHPMQRF